MTTALLLGRFQPFHNGHLYAIKKAASECDKLIIAIGSSQYAHTDDNPFSAEERKTMIASVLKKDFTYSVVWIPDIHSDAGYVRHVEKLCPKFDVVYTGNEHTKGLFEKKYLVVELLRIDNIFAEEIRNHMIQGLPWQSMVPKEVAELIKAIKGVERIKGLIL